MQSITPVETQQTDELVTLSVKIHASRRRHLRVLATRRATDMGYIVEAALDAHIGPPPAEPEPSNVA